ncbi:MULTISPECIES: O-antigen ligase family protein [unclassified Carboxylicivirga]|uniref:O-antigen ligase family protein n=1 Tax=Carboxylicivirga TaxID=1628153 RepID=UPI003D344EBB
MYKQILLEKNNYLTLLFWLLIGIVAGPLTYVAVPVHVLMIKQKGQWLWILLGFWLVLTVSDSRQGIFSFAKNLKTAMILVMGYLYMTAPKGRYDHLAFLRPFIPFFALAFFSLLSGPVGFTGFQKTLSYLLLLVIIPFFVNLLITYERDRFLYHLVMIGVLVLTAGLALRFMAPGFVMFAGGRYSGLLGNPNAIGIYGFLFFALFTLTIHFQKHLFTRPQIIFIYSVILASLILAGSRGGIFSALLFTMAYILFKRSVLVAFVVMSLVFASYQYVMANFETIVTSLGLAEYFRLESLDSGSGRLVVAEIAWKHIKMNYWFSYGFTYHLHILAQYADYFVQHGHQGNVHNSWLTIWMDTGLVGLILFAYGWLANFRQASRLSPLVWAVLFGMLLSISVESWLVASLNPFTIVLVIILSMLGNEGFYRNEELGCGT